MTQAVNLANFANNLDTSGGLNPSALNAAVPVAKGGTGATTAATARTNLGVTGTGADTTYMYRANNLSDVANTTSARSNIGVGNVGTLNTNGNTGTYLRGDGNWAAVPSTGVTSFAGQTGAVDPTSVNNIGSITTAFPMISAPGVPNSTASNSTLYAPNSTIAGSSLAYAAYGKIFGWGGTNVLHGNLGSFAGDSISGYNNPKAFPASGSQPSYGYNLGYYTASYFYYSTGLSGSWRALTYSGAVSINDGCGTLRCWFTSGLWTRYA